MTTVKKTELYDLGKIITTMLVVFAHAAGMYTKDGAYQCVVSSPFLAGAHEVIYAFHMPYFMFLSGCVYGYCIEHGKYRDTGRYILGKAKKLLIPYVLIGAAYVAPAMVLLGLTEQRYGQYVLDGILMSLNARHLWYILTLFWICLLAIPLRKLPMEGVAKWVTILVISGVLFVFSRVLCYRIRFRHLQLTNALYYQMFYFVGMIFNDAYDYFERIPNRFKLCLLAGSVAILLTELLPGSSVLLGLLSKFAGIGMMVIVQWFLLRNVHRGGTLVRDMIGRNSFGIYLFHPVIIYVLYSRLHTLEISPLLLASAVTVVSCGISILMTMAVRKLRLGLLIGE